MTLIWNFGRSGGGTGVLAGACAVKRARAGAAFQICPPFGTLERKEV